MALVEREQILEGVVRLTFNRPDKLNALSTALIDEFEAHLEELATNRDARVVILAGAGGKAFVAGADIGEYADGETEAFIAFQRRGRRVNDALEALPQVTIAAVDGYALGGGFEIALCCDVIIASENARFGLPEGLLGLSPGGGGTQRLLRSVGRHVAADVLLTGRRLSGDRAAQLGLAAEVVPSEALSAAVLDKARYVLRVAPGSVRAIKELLRAGADAALPSALALEQEVLFRLYGTAEGREGVRAFVEKRTPAFRTDP